MPLLLLFLLLGAAEPGSGKPSASDVLAMMARIPVVEVAHTEAQKRPGHWDKIGVAAELARAQAEVAPTRLAAALMAVYAAFEGGNQRCAVGDGGKSLGPYQLQRVPESVACDPMQATLEWRRRADDSWHLCAKRPDGSVRPAEERLGRVAGGSCDTGLELVRRRARLAEQIAAEP